jgi:hypothetical protein
MSSSLPLETISTSGDHSSPCRIYEIYCNDGNYDSIIFWTTICAVLAIIVITITIYILIRLRKCKCIYESSEHENIRDSVSRERIYNYGSAQQGGSPTTRVLTV